MTQKWNLKHIIAGGLLLIAQSVWAQSWTTAASSCVVDDGSATLYSFDNGTFQFKAGKTGTIKARCAITNPIDGVAPGWNALRVGYQDADGVGLNDQVLVQLVRVVAASGAAFVVKTLDSNDFVAIDPTISLAYFTHAWDFANSAYYLVINVDRSSTLDNAGVWFARLSLN